MNLRETTTTEKAEHSGLEWSTFVPWATPSGMRLLPQQPGLPEIKSTSRKIKVQAPQKSGYSAINLCFLLSI